MALRVDLFRCRVDNYGVVLYEREGGDATAIDAPDGLAVERILSSRSLRLTTILVTHGHADHVEGISSLRSRYGCEVIGSSDASPRIDGLTRFAGDGDVIEISGGSATALLSPGHAAGHLAWSFPSEGLLFSGDALFPMGCGRLFGGTASELHGSLSRFAALPDATRIYCGHDYDAGNARFALSVDSGNAALRFRAEAILGGDVASAETAPTSVGLEKATNPFMRCASVEIRRALAMDGDVSEVEVFAELRRRKDVF